jgi:hypothetical protein
VFNGHSTIEHAVFNDTYADLMTSGYVLGLRYHYIINNGNPTKFQTDLDEILKCGCERFESSLSENTESFRDRFFTYRTNSEDIYTKVREHFEKDFCKLIEAMPLVIEQNAKEIIKKWVTGKDAALQNVIAGYQQLLDDRKRCEEELKEYTGRSQKK